MDTTAARNPSQSPHPRCEPEHSGGVHPNPREAEAVRELFRSALVEGVSAGEVRSDLDAEHLASLLLCTTYGVQVMARAKAPAHTITEAIEGTLTLIAAED